MPAASLPSDVRALLYDCDPDSISWEEHRGFLIDRVLSEGSWSTIHWLRQQVGDAALRARIMATHGRRLSPRQLRFWQVVLELPDELVARWLGDPARRIWDRRSDRA